MKSTSHNFKKLDFSFPKIDGKEFGTACYLSEAGCSFGGIGYGPMFGGDAALREQARANARRIAACVNYCASMTTEQLEDAVKI